MPGSFARGLSAALTYFSSIVPVQYSEARSPWMNFDVPVLTIISFTIYERLVGNYVRMFSYCQASQLGKLGCCY